MNYQFRILGNWRSARGIDLADAHTLVIIVVGKTHAATDRAEGLLALVKAASAAR